MKLYRKLHRYINLWTFLAGIIIILILLPNLAVLKSFFLEEAENWEHIKEYILPDLLKNTGLILVATGILTVLIGTSLAWLVSAYDFPMRRFYKWALILPLSIPPYIAAYTYNGILNYTGVIQSTLRNRFDIQVNQSYFDIMNLPGAVFIFTLFLFPYVYMITSAFLRNQTVGLIENARLLGRNAFEIFFMIVLPIARVAIIGGVSLVLLEVLNDYGVVQFFGVPTFTTAIFQTWFGMGDLPSAIKLSATLMFIVFAILLLEKVTRGRKRYSYTTAKNRRLTTQTLRGWKAWIIFGYCSVIFALGFLIPIIQLFDWTLLTYEKIWSPVFKSLIINSVSVALIGAFLIVVSAVIVANFARMHQSALPKLSARTTILGYSIPGAVISVGILTVFLAIDDYLFGLYNWLGIDKQLFLSASIVLLLSAYIIRFLAVGFNAIEAGFEEAGNKFSEASRMLGSSITGTFFKIDLPMIRSAILGGFVLSFIEILKELPLTMILRPFNFDTLSTKAFQYANDEQIHEAALASIIIVVISAITIFIFYNILDREKD